MATGSDNFHEDSELLRPETKERHRAIVSLQEECEAVDWYDQRIDATEDHDLAGILAHNRDEEKEHAAMTLEWLRRHDAAWDEHLRTYLFTTLPVLEVEQAAETAETAEAAGEGDASPGDGDLGIRSLRGRSL